MSWKDLFKSRSSGRHADPRLRWFGKLPSYADYYSSPAEEGWAVEFHEWIIRGYELYLRRSMELGERGRRLPPSIAMVRLPESQMTVLCSLRDYGGDMRGRRFPLLFFVGVPTGQCPGPTADTVAAPLRVLRELGAMHDEVGRFLNAPGRFDTRFAGREVDLSELESPSGDGTWKADADRVDFEQWVDGIDADSSPADAPRWMGRAIAWGDRLAEAEGSAFEPTLSLPLSKGVPADVQIAGWLSWLGARMRVDKRVLTVIATGDLARAPGVMHVVARALMPEDFLLATPVRGGLGYVDVLPAKLTDEASGDRKHEAGEQPPTWAAFVSAQQRDS